jgi:hypothetical protein
VVAFGGARDHSRIARCDQSSGQKRGEGELSGKKIPSSSSQMHRVRVNYCGCNTIWKSTSWSLTWSSVACVCGAA